MKSERHWEHLLSLGSNIDPDRWVPRALELAGRRFEVTAVSASYDVPAVGGSARSPAFVNLALRMRTDLPPRALNAACRRIEEACERQRAVDRYAPRTLDLDVVYSVGPGGATPRVHRDLLDAAYVLVPCADIWPAAVLSAGETLGGRAAALFPDWRTAHAAR